jgi:hypothetical protein
MTYPLAFKQSVWISIIGEKYKTECIVCKSYVTAFDFDIFVDNNIKYSIKHLHC